MNCKSKIQYVLAVLLPLAAYAEVTAVAPTMVSSCYQIDSLANLRWVSENSSSWSSCFVQTKDIDASETSGWNSGAGFVSIGNNAINFTGSFNGKSHVIKGLAINRPTTDYVGLFGFLGHGAVVDSLSVRSASLTGQKQTGIIAGYNVGKIQHSNTSGTVTGSDGAGGLVGFDSAAIVTLCYSTATVNGALGVGGLVGNNVGKSVITQSYATGVVTGGTGASDYTAGGLVGFNATDDTIRNSYALGHVSGNAAVGGFVGSNYGVIEKGYSVGRVTTTATTGLVFGFTTNNNNIGKTTASFWDTSASGIDSSKGGSTRNTTQMQSQSTFTDSSWDFTNTWAIVTGVNGGYPLLQALAYLPQVSTQAVSDVAITSATGNGSLDVIGSSEVTDHGFCWNTTGSPTIYDSKVDLDATWNTGAFTGSLTGLSANTTYYVRTYATNGAGTSYGSAVSLTTLLATPTVTTSTIVSPFSTKAVVHGNLTYLGSGVTAHGFCWSVGTSPAVGSDSCVNLGITSVTGAFNDTIVGLSKGSAYYVRAFATTDAGTNYGNAVSFKTSPLAGSGTDADPYLVASYADLEQVGIEGSSLSAVYRLTADIDASSSALENSYRGFVPIGPSSSNGFKGKFHGGGHVISELSTNHTVHDEGLFGFIDSGSVVDSLGLVGGSISGPDVSGNLAGENKGTIIRCYATGSVKGWGGDGIDVGGLVGINYGTIVNSYATGFIVCIHESSTGTFSAGGLVGANMGGSIIGSYATGSVVSTGEVDGEGGGLVGINTYYDRNNLRGYGNITQSYASGDVIVTSSNGANGYSGGIVGLNDIGGNITESFTTSDVLNASFSGKFLGNLAGKNDGSITKCYWNSTQQVNSSVTACGYGSTIACNNHNGLTTSEMLQSTNLDSLDFTNTWYQYNGHTYPLLRALMTPLTITAKDSIKTYDGTAFTGGNGISYSLPNTQISKILGTPNFGGTNQLAKDTGSYTITIDSLWSTQQGYLISIVNGTLRINPKELTLTGLSAQSKIYDGNISATLAGSASLNGIVNSENISVAGTASASFADKNAGTAKTVTVTGLSLDGTAKSNYSLSSSLILNANITPYPITVTADAKTITQGDSNVTLTYSATPLLTTDTWAGELARIAGDTAGTYAITQGTLDAGLNYAITFNGADYVIHARPIEVALLPTRTTSQGFFITHQSGDVLDVTYNTSFAGNVNVDIYSLRGQKMLSVNCGVQNAGAYFASIQTSLPVGIYTATLRVNGFAMSTIKLVKTGK